MQIAYQRQLMDKVKLFSQYDKCSSLRLPASILMVFQTTCFIHGVVFGSVGKEFLLFVEQIKL